MPAARVARPRCRPGRTADCAGRGRLPRRDDRPLRARRAPPLVRHLRPDMTIRSRRYRCLVGVDQCPPDPDLNATLADEILIYRGSQTVMAGLVPAIHAPDAAAFDAKK